MTLTSGAGAAPLMQPVLARLRSFGLGLAETAMPVSELTGPIKRIAPKALVPNRSALVDQLRFVIEGWACRFQDLPDGRRQVFDLILPGDSLDTCANSNLFADVSALALTSLRFASLDPVLLEGGTSDGLTVFQAHGRASSKRALRQMLRLGRMTALERLADLFFELYERLEAVEMTEGALFAFPLTQETLGDLTGLSVVHVNRTLQEMRRRGLLILERGKACIPDAEALAEVACRRPLPVV